MIGTGLAVAGCIACIAATGTDAHADDGTRRLRTAERQVLAESAAWGAINTLSDGSLGVIIQRARPGKMPMSRVPIARSRRGEA